MSRHTNLQSALRPVAITLGLALAWPARAADTLVEGTYLRVYYDADGWMNDPTAGAGIQFFDGSAWNEMSYTTGYSDGMALEYTYLGASKSSPALSSLGYGSAF